MSCVSPRQTHAAPARRPRREIQPSEGSGCPAAGAGTRRASLGVSRAPPGAGSSGAVTIFGSAAGAGSGGGGFSSSFSSSSRNVSQPSPGQGCSAQTPGSEGGSQPLPGAAGHTKLRSQVRHHGSELLFGASPALVAKADSGTLYGNNPCRLQGSLPASTLFFPWPPLAQSSQGPEPPRIHPKKGWSCFNVSYPSSHPAPSRHGGALTSAPSIAARYDLGGIPSTSSQPQQRPPPSPAKPFRCKRGTNPSPRGAHPP